MLSFKQVYLAYVAILAILVGSATFYVRSLLRDYEAAQPEQRAWEVAEALASDATAGRFWDRFPLPAVSLGPYEQGMDLQTGYPALFTGEDLRAIPKSGQHGEDELTYLITSGDFPLAEVHLQAVGPAVTRLGLFTTREWAATDIQLLLEPRDYYMDLPPSHYFTVRLNGQDLTADASGRYSVSGLYLKPVFAIADPSGAPANYAIKDGQILPELYSYDLTLPAALLVDTDKGFYQGNAVENDQIRHVIASIEKPSVTISDTYGNTIPYEGGALPLTRITITAEEGYTVSVQGQPAVPNRTFFPDEYAHFAEFVPGLPQTQVYDIVILRENGEAVVTDPAGTAATLLAGEHTLTAQPAPLDAVPAELGGRAGHRPEVEPLYEQRPGLLQGVALPDPGFLPVPGGLPLRPRHRHHLHQPPHPGRSPLHRYRRHQLPVARGGAVLLGGYPLREAYAPGQRHGGGRHHERPVLLRLV